MLLEHRHSNTPMPSWRCPHTAPEPPSPSFTIHCRELPAKRQHNHPLCRAIVPHLHFDRCLFHHRQPIATAVECNPTADYPSPPASMLPLSVLLVPSLLVCVMGQFSSFCRVSSHCEGDTWLGCHVAPCHVDHHVTPAMTSTLPHGFFFVAMASKLSILML